MNAIYDNINKYINNSVDPETRNNIADFAILWNNYENRVFDKGYSFSKINTSLLELINFEKNFVDDIYTKLISYLNTYCDTSNPENIYNYFKVRNSDIKKEDFLCLFNDINNNRALIILLLVGRVRNNMFHGIKDITKIDKEKELFVICNTVLTYVLSNLNKLDICINNYEPRFKFDYLDTKTNRIRYELEKFIDLSDDNLVENFLHQLSTIINECLKQETFQIFKVFPIYTSKINFAVIFYLLKKDATDNNGNVKCLSNFCQIENYIDKEIDIFNLVNFIREEY